MTFPKNHLTHLNYKIQDAYASFLHGRFNMNFEATDIFTFDPEWIYEFYLLDNIKLTGALIDARDNGIVLNDGMHIPTDKIVCFKPVSQIQKTETD